MIPMEVLGQDPSCLFQPLGPGFLSSGPHPWAGPFLSLQALGPGFLSSGHIPPGSVCSPRPSRFMSEFQISLFVSDSKACWI